MNDRAPVQCLWKWHSDCSRATKKTSTDLHAHFQRVRTWQYALLGRIGFGYAFLREIEIIAILYRLCCNFRHVHLASTKQTISFTQLPMSPRVAFPNKPSNFILFWWIKALSAHSCHCKAMTCRIEGDRGPGSNGPRTGEPSGLAKVDPQCTWLELHRTDQRRSPRRPPVPDRLGDWGWYLERTKRGVGFVQNSRLLYIL